MAERTFVLHDGTDENKTNELHAFLKDVPIEDWEGHDSGIYIFPKGWPDEVEDFLSVAVGDTIVIDDENNITVRKKSDGQAQTDQG